MPVELAVANHLRIAAEDLRAARALLPSGNRNVAYLCQQAAEKVAKAVLESEGIFYGREHRNEVLAAMVPSENLFKPTLDGLADLAPYATAYRYPKPAGRIPPPPTAAAMESMVARVDEALAKAARLFGVDLTATDSMPAADASPIRGDRSPLQRPGPVRRK